MRVSNIPESDSSVTLKCLESARQWMPWKVINGDKIPLAIDPKGKGNGFDPKPWGTHEQLVFRMRADKSLHEAIGLGPIQDDSGLFLCGVDLDDCFDVFSAPKPHAAEILARFGTYAETSPSGNGIKLIFLTNGETEARLAEAMDGKLRKQFVAGTHNEVALDRKRFYAVTRNRVDGCPETLRLVPFSDLEWLLDVAGPAFLRAEGVASDAPDGTGKRTKPGVDRSTEAFSFAAGRLRENPDLSLDDLIALLRADTGPVGEWAADQCKKDGTPSRAGLRQFTRAFERAKEGVVVITADSWEDDLPDIGFDPLGDEPENVTPITGQSAVVRRYNRQFAYVERGGKSAIIVDDPKFPRFREWGAFKLDRANDRVPQPDDPKKLIPAADIWLTSPHRRSYRECVFLPNDKPMKDQFNLWRGFPIEASGTNEDCRLILTHIRDVVCSGNVDHARYVIGWLAHLVQRPQDKPGVAVVLRGLKGVGKDTLAEYVGKILGIGLYRSTSNPEHFLGRFNGTLERCLLLHVEEGTWAGDKQAESIQKNLITAKTMTYEDKGVDPKIAPSYLRLFISSNEDWIVPASADERRWAIFDVADDKRGDSSYFTALRDEMDGKGPAALLRYLESFDLSDFDVRKPPHTAALDRQKNESLRGVEAWWADLLTDGSLSEWDADVMQIYDWSQESMTIATGRLRELFDEWLRKQPYKEAISNQKFGLEIRRLTDGKGERVKRGGRDARHWAYVLPPLQRCRAAFESVIGRSYPWEMDQ
ncbi:DUF5906 domain-containing protein [Acetobacter sicerae]|uniref:DUF5906 domain-containing protein n=1 Tax=Acetobacter sicerae TaxID=85325 RepID=A0ABS8VUZ9_9PROT|nr:DUF5906 domain-containing protein [Acetobacter sicerae]MCE0742909.1 DUF5906 domain-containing protein [Acetobacter sicerae]